MGRLDINGAKMAPMDYLWTQTHAGCATPWKPCMGEYVYEMGYPTVVRYECGNEKIMSYVNSSRYETETALQTAERKLKEAKDELDRVKRSLRFGTEPSSGSILKFEKRFNGGTSKVYYYAAIRIGSQWFLTTSLGTTSPKTWEELKDFIGDSKCWAPRNYELLPSA